MKKLNPWNWSETRQVYRFSHLHARGGRDVICESWWGICQTQLKSCQILAGQEMGKGVNFAEIYIFLHLSTSSRGKWFSWWEKGGPGVQGSPKKEKPHRKWPTDFGQLQFDWTTSPVLCINCRFCSAEGDQFIVDLSIDVDANFCTALQANQKER